MSFFARPGGQSPRLPMVEVEEDEDWPGLVAVLPLWLPGPPR